MVQPRPRINLANGRLSVDLQQADIRIVLSRIARQVGFSLRMAPTGADTINVQFRDLTLIDGLRRLLHSASLSYAMVYEAKADTTGGLKELWVFSTASHGSATLPSLVEAHDQLDAPPPKHSLLGVLSRLQPQNGQTLAPALSPQPNTFLDALDGQPSKVATPPAATPFLEALKGKHSEVTDQWQYNPFLGSTSGQRKP